MEMLIMLLLLGCTCGSGLDPIGDTTDAAWACGKSSVTISDTNDQDCDDAKDNMKKTYIILGFILVGGICLLVVCCTCGPCIALKLTECGCKCIVRVIEKVIEWIWCGCCQFFKELWSLIMLGHKGESKLHSNNAQPEPPDFDGCEFTL